MSHRYFEIIVTGRQLALLIALAAALVLGAFGLGVGVGIQQEGRGQISTGRGETIPATAGLRPEARGQASEVGGLAPVPTASAIVGGPASGRAPSAVATTAAPTEAPSPTPSLPVAATAPTAAPPVAAVAPTAAARGQQAGKERVVQVVALSHMAAAEGVRQRVLALGFRPAQATIQAVGGKYRVRLGPFPDEESARRVAGRLQAEGFPGAFVVKPGE